MERTVRVTGRGRISVAPDTVRLVITQTELADTYEGAVRTSGERKKELSEGLTSAGLEKNALKTLYFNIDTEYESYQARDKSWQRRFRGYRFTHRMKLEMPVAAGGLGRVLGVIARSKGEPEFTIQYTVADPEEAKNELLAKAVEDSAKKARVLTSAAGTVLGDIISIDYSWSEIDVTGRSMNGYDVIEKGVLMDSCASEDIDIDIDADDIDLTDTVTVVWTISAA